MWSGWSWWGRKGYFKLDEICVLQGVGIDTAISDPQRKRRTDRLSEEDRAALEAAQAVVTSAWLPPADIEAYLRVMTTAVASLVERALPTLSRYGVQRASVFGSYARGEAGPESAFDVLVELPSGSSLLDLVGLEQALSNEVGVQVEATTHEDLHPLLHDRVLQDAVVRRIEIIDEAVKKNQPRELREATVSVPWRQIAGMRAAEGTA